MVRVFILVQLLNKKDAGLDESSQPHDRFHPRANFCFYLIVKKAVAILVSRLQKKLNSTSVSVFLSVPI